jgi:hypothetical protein
LQFTPMGRASFRVDRNQPTWPAPEATRDVDVALYRLAAYAPLPWRPALGADDVGSVLGGWHAPETFMGERGRWTEREADLKLPQFDCAAGRQPSIGAIRFASIRPPAVGQPHVSVSIERQEVLRVTPQDSRFHVYLIRLSDELVRHLCGSPATLSITSDSFVPARDAGLRDDRELGVAVAWVELQPSTPAAPHE